MSAPLASARAAECVRTLEPTGGMSAEPEPEAAAAASLVTGVETEEPITDEGDCLPARVPFDALQFDSEACPPPPQYTLLVQPPYDDDTDTCSDSRGRNSKTKHRSPRELQLHTIA